jgi:hypothetical protein
MSVLRVLAVAVLASAVAGHAAYAPIPEQEQGRDFTVTVRTGVSYDSNIFGAPPSGTLAGDPAAVGAIDSFVYTVAPKAVYAVSLTEQTFFSGGYGLTLDYVHERPGRQLLDSHDLSLRVAHAFTRRTTLDLNNVLSVLRNPEALLPGIAALPGLITEDRTANPDQSFRRNQLDGRFVTAITPKVGVTAKARSVHYAFRNPVLARSLDRVENLFGLAGDYAVLPEMKAVAEYRHQDVYYRKLGDNKNKRSDFVMAGVDYDAARKLTISSRLGVEWRQRSAERSTTAPYAELFGRYDYAPRSFIAGGYGYSLDETSDTQRFTDMRVNRLFVNVQHQITALIVGSGSVMFEPSQLQGRRGVRSVDEDTIRLGGAISYLPGRSWTIAASCDYDRVRSDLPSRAMRRTRVALNATRAF